jgi:hypothetical protein
MAEFNGQTSDQEHVLRMYADSTAGAGYTNLDAVIDSLIDGSLLLNFWELTYNIRLCNFKEEVAVLSPLFFIFTIVN